MNYTKLIGAIGIEKHQPIVILTNEFKMDRILMFNFYLCIPVQVSKCVTLSVCILFIVCWLNSINDSSKTVFILMLGLSFVLVTTQGISNNYSKYSAEGSNAGNGIGISPPDINIETDSDNKNASDLSDLLGGQGDSEGSNQTGNGLTGDLLNSETSSEGSNETDDGDTDVAGSSESTNETGETEDQSNNLDVNINNNMEIKQRLDLIISEEEGEAPIPKQEQDKVESQDKIVVT